MRSRGREGVGVLGLSVTVRGWGRGAGHELQQPTQGNISGLFPYVLEVKHEIVLMRKTDDMKIEKNPAFC